MPTLIVDNVQAKVYGYPRLAHNCEDFMKTLCAIKWRSGRWLA
jgi:hypothetical protein